MKRERRLASGDEDWEIRQDGAQLLIDNSAKQTTRKFVSIDHASIQFDKLVAEKVEAGWEETTARRRPRRAAPTTDAEPRDEALEAAVLADRTDPNARSVYGDWYEQRGHPRGTLIALQLDERERYGDETREERILRHLRHYTAVLLGPLARHITIDGDSPFEWFGGFIHAVELAPHDAASPQQILRELVAHPSGRLLADVTAVITKRTQVSSVIGALRKHPILSLKLVTDKGLQDELAQLRSLKTLRRFALSVVQCARDERPHEIETSTNVLRAICELPPSVEHIELRLDGYIDEPDALAPLFRRGDLKLRTLALRAPTILAAMLDQLLSAAWAPTLETLDAALIGADRLCELLLANRERFPALTELRLTTNVLPERLLEQLDEHYDVVHRGDRDAKFFEDSVGAEYFFRPISE